MQALKLTLLDRGAGSFPEPWWPQPVGTGAIFRQGVWVTEWTRLNMWSGALPDGTQNAPPPRAKLEIQPLVSHL